MPESRKRFSNLRAVGIITIAILLYVLLVDVAVETFLSNSPVRWWVGGVVVIYLAGSAALWWRSHSLWDRLDWAAKATVSFFVLLGLVGLSVWLPDGFTQGITLFTLSTSTLLSLVTAAAIVLSAIILMQIRYPYPAVKWAVALLATYALVSVAWAIYSDNPYSGLFDGESFWSWLPRLLQGAFIGAFVIVPAALLYLVVSALLRTRSEGPKDLTA